MDAELSVLDSLRDSSHAFKQVMIQELMTGGTGLI